MESYRDIYQRFIENYRTETGGINLYPQFDYDLELLLTWLENDDCMEDVLTNGSFNVRTDYYKQSEGEVNE